MKILPANIHQQLEVVKVAKNALVATRGSSGGTAPSGQLAPVHVDQATALLQIEADKLKDLIVTYNAEHPSDPIVKEDLYAAFGQRALASATQGQELAVCEQTELSVQQIAGGYSQKFTRKTPGLVEFLIDGSSSMLYPYGASKCEESRASVLARMVNSQIAELMMKCARYNADEELELRDYFHFGALNFCGERVVKNVLPGGKATMPMTELYNQVRRMDKGPGGEDIPVFVEASADGKTPMAEAFTEATKIVKDWASEHQDSFPPIVMMFTDGAHNNDRKEDDPVGPAAALRNVSTKDGHALLFNIHLSGTTGAKPVLFPSSPSELPPGDEYARKLFEMSSPLPQVMVDLALAMGLPIKAGARAFAYNCEASHIEKLLVIGTQANIGAV